MPDDIELAAQVADEWSKPQSMLLHAGEMTAQELRTAIAVAIGIAAAIRNLQPKKPDAWKVEFGNGDVEYWSANEFPGSVPPWGEVATPLYAGKPIETHDV